MCVILPYHITFAQGGICQHCDKGFWDNGLWDNGLWDKRFGTRAFWKIPLIDSATAGELSFVLDEVDQDIVAEGLMIREKRTPTID